MRPLRLALAAALPIALVFSCGEEATIPDEEVGTPPADDGGIDTSSPTDAGADAIEDAGQDAEAEAAPPDPRSILFLTRDEFRQWRVQPDGGNPTPITDGDSLGARWILNRQRIVYWHTGGAAGSTVRTALPDGGDDTFLTTGNAPHWDAPGQRVVFRRDRDLYRIQLDGGGEERLTYDGPSTGIEGYVSPDGTQMLIRTSPGYCVSKYEADAGRTCAATCRGPFSWHPDGTRFICERSYNNFDSRIVLINLALGTDVELTDGTRFDFSAAWSPDGKSIVFARGLGPANTGAELHVMNADGTGIVKITSGLGAQEPDWR